MANYRYRYNPILRYGNILASVLLLVLVCAQITPLTVASKGGVWFVVVGLLFVMAGYRDAHVLTAEPKQYGLHALWTIAFIVGVDCLTSFIEYAQQTEPSLSTLLSVVRSHLTMFTILGSVLLVAVAGYVIGVGVGVVQQMLLRADAENAKQGRVREHSENADHVSAMLLNALGEAGRHPLLFLAWYRMGTYYAFVWEAMPVGVEIALRCLYPVLLTAVTLRIQQIYDARLEAEDERLINGIGDLYWDHIHVVDVVFYVAAFATFLMSMIDGTTLLNLVNRDLFNVLYHVTQCLLLLVALLRMWDDKSHRLTAVQCGILGIGVILSYLSGYAVVLSLLMVAAEGVSAKRILQFHVCISLVIMTIAAWASVHGYVTYYFSNGRHAMGISYRTTYADYWLYIMVMYRVLRGKRMRLIEYVGSVILTVYVYHLSAGKSAFAAAVLFLGLCTLADYWPQQLRNVHVDGLIYRLGYAVYPLCAAITFVVVAIKGAQLAGMDLDTSSFLYTFRARIALSYEAFTRYPLRLLCQKVSEQGAVTMENDLNNNYYFFIDNSFVRILIIDGIIFFLIVMGINVYMMVRCHRELNMIMMIALIAVAVHSLSEPQMVSITFNVLMVLVYAVWDMDEKRKSKALVE